METIILLMRPTARQVQLHCHDSITFTYQYDSLLSNSVTLLVVAMYYFFAIIGMEAFRYQVYPQCWYGYIHMHNHAATVSLL